MVIWLSVSPGHKEHVTRHNNLMCFAPPPPYDHSGFKKRMKRGGLRNNFAGITGENIFFVLTH
jgi:hypothetical protein